MTLKEAVPRPKIAMARLFAFILTLALTFALIAGVAFARDYEVKKVAGEYEAGVRIDRCPPAVGDNLVEIEVKDALGKPVTDAKVFVNYYMPPMPRMAPMNYITDAKLKGERYRAKMNFIMSGPWIIAIKICRGEKTRTVKFNVDAQ